MKEHCTLISQYLANHNQSVYTLLAVPNAAYAHYLMGAEYLLWATRASRSSVLLAFS